MCINNQVLHNLTFEILKEKVDLKNESPSEILKSYCDIFNELNKTSKEINNKPRMGVLK